MKLRWNPAAEYDLYDIHSYIAKDQPINADRFVARLIERAEEATLYPHKHRKAPELDRDDVREVFEGQYRIIFQVHTHEVEVIAVLHGSRLLRDLIL